MNLNIQRLHPEAILPSRAHEHDAGYDLYADETRWLNPGEWRLFPTGIALQIPAGHVGDIRSRSGLGAKGIIVGQGVGTIDAGYRGEVKVNLYNRKQSPYYVQAGDRIAQLVIIPIPTVTVMEVGSLDDTERGAGGFGSSGL